MSGDGPSKVVSGVSLPHAEAGPHAEPLDDIILGDDEPANVPPVVATKASAPPPVGARSSPSKLPDRPSAPPTSVGPPPRKDRTSNRVETAVDDGRDANESQGRKRARMTLRIPDDEISRPNLPATTPAGGVPAISLTGTGERPVVSGSRPPSAPEPAAHAKSGDHVVIPMAGPKTDPAPPALGVDDTLELPPDDLRARLAAITGESAALASPAAGIDPSNERGWTPFQPHVERDAALPIEPTAIIPLNDGANGLDSRGTVLDMHELDGMTTPISEDIPVDMDLSGMGSVPDGHLDDDKTHPRLPVVYDSEEIRIDETDRASETGEVEVSPEDLVSVESLPSPVHAPPPVKTAGKSPVVKANDGASGPTAASLMAGVGSSAASSQPHVAGAQASQGLTPVTPPVAPAAPVHHEVAPPPAMATPVAHLPPVAPSAPPSPLAATGAHAPPVMSAAHAPAQVPAAPAQAAPAPAPSGGAARRQSNPLVFVPPVGALAPPPMTDAVAGRKKTRPWWEELFNDDYIRTMAKVTDHQIRKEVNFIEESLGCEAGAMVLDLACGTGRHAVELAARGYQVVGFDLSLAMLARASDEAQDRKQKINFVQGDMREMTFEETFDGIYSWNTSFGYFDEEKNGAVIARVHKALKKGGQFLLDVVNRDYIIRQAPSLAWFEGDGCICMDEMTIDFITSRMKVKRTLMMDDGRTKEIEYSIRAYALHELGKMLHDNGFRVAEVSGRTGTPGVFFGCEAPRTLILAEKR